MTWLVAAALLASGGWLTWQRLQTLLAYFQQDEYDGKRFWAAIFEVRLFDIIASCAALAIGSAILLSGISGAWWCALAAVFILITLRERRYVFKKPLVLTARAKRILQIAAFLMAPAIMVAALWPWAFLIALQLPPIALILSNRLLAPRQHRINEGYIEEARAKLHRMRPVTIGITGSFGKTTVKHMLAGILEASAPVFYSRGSINTELGLTRHIRQRLQWGHRYFIAEMGAYGVGSVRRLCNFARPDYGIVTAVGDAHTERFGSLEAIAMAKSELAEEVCRNGGLVAMDAALLQHAPFAKLYDENPGKILTVGPGAADIVIEQAHQRDGYWHISLRGSDGQIPNVDFAIPLLGQHNVMNAALVMTMALSIAPNAAAQFCAAATQLNQIPHRLQKRERPGEPLVLDDAYNSNEAGFLNALTVAQELAKSRNGKSILVTPGLAELGHKHEKIHATLGAAAAKSCDLVVVVNPDRIPSFCQAIESNEVGKLLRASDLPAARSIISRLAETDDVILYENDLPDLLEKTRLL